MAGFIRFFARRRALAIVASLGCAAPALAQLQLPGAVAPAGQGTVVTPASPAAKPKPKGPPPPPKVFGDETLLGRTLQQNGRVGALQFSRDGKDLKIARLTFSGDRISRPGERCTFDAPGAPLALAPNGRPRGLVSYRTTAGACELAFDVLDGAVLMSMPGGVCAFPESDCKVDAAGLWGQPAGEVTPARVKEIERARAGAEQTMRNHFREWTQSVSKDRDLVRRLSREQAGFSSRRAEICDAYARESENGYCALLLTQARSVALAARVPPPDLPPPEPDGPGRRRPKR